MKFCKNQEIDSPPLFSERGHPRHLGADTNGRWSRAKPENVSPSVRRSNPAPVKLDELQVQSVGIDDAWCHVDRRTCFCESRETGGNDCLRRVHARERNFGDACQGVGFIVLDQYSGSTT